MKRYLKLLGLGFFVWLTPFVISFFVFPTKTIFPPFFETVMAVTVVATGMGFTILGFRGVTTGFVKEGLWLGLCFLGVSLLIDLSLFSAGPMAMSFGDYMLDIGLTYLIYPIISIGVGYMLATRLLTTASLGQMAAEVGKK